MSPLVKLYGRNLLNVRDRDRNTLERERPDEILDFSTSLRGFSVINTRYVKTLTKLMYI